MNRVKFSRVELVKEVLVELILTWVSVLLVVGVGSPCAEVWRVVNLLAVVPLEVSVHSVETLELKAKLVFESYF